MDEFLEAQRVYRGVLLTLIALVMGVIGVGVAGYLVLMS